MEEKKPLIKWPGLYSVIFGDKDIPVSYSSDEPLPLDVSVEQKTREMVITGIAVIALAAVLITYIKKRG